MVVVWDQMVKHWLEMFLRPTMVLVVIGKISQQVIKTLRLLLWTEIQWGIHGLLITRVRIINNKKTMTNSMVIVNRDQLMHLAKQQPDKLLLLVLDRPVFITQSWKNLTWKYFSLKVTVGFHLSNSVFQLYNVFCFENSNRPLTQVIWNMPAAWWMNNLKWLKIFSQQRVSILQLFKQSKINRRLVSKYIPKNKN